ncbi:hypothetical protein BD626DRAFT_474778 [Schizophyllum amplum]|uniref:Glycine zipper domain-containing protein n=1 Tax=Schizophyllum amplum TaxID=97359 RepID=A0A550CXW0_9AGAR|nr:hypothetical protein BD626DRAFT_474778 [Auriculariopsis ampla]
MGNATSRDGSVTTFCEKLPVIGYGVAAIQLIAGNPEHAKRAAATSTNAVITTTGAVLGSVAGAAVGVVGGPAGVVAGAIAGGGIGSAAAAQVGMVVEYGISTTIDDEKVKGGVGEVSWKRAGKDALIGAVTGAAGGAFGASSVTGAMGKVTVETSTQAALVGGASVVSDASTKLILENVSKQGFPADPAVDDDKPKMKEPRRVVTLNQDNEAKSLRAYCIYMKTQYPLKVILDVYMNASNFFDMYVVTGADWHFATECVEAACTELAAKREGENGSPETYRWLQDEINWATRLGRGTPIPADAQNRISEASRTAILDEIDRRTQEGGEPFDQALEGLMRALDEEFVNLKRLMYAETQFM